MEDDLVVQVDLMNERGDSWRLIGSGTTVDAAVARVEQYANSRAGSGGSDAEWVMSDWRAL